MARLELKNVSKRFGDLNVVHRVDLAIGETEFVVLVGPSGCGKSTILRMIAGLEEASGGEIVIEGATVNELAPKNRNIAMVFQDYALYPHLTVAGNMSFGLENQKIPRTEIAARVSEAAQILGLEALMDRKPRQLSGGQRQRVAMGRAIVRKPKVFLFDEPLSNLDAKLRGQMRTEIKKLHRRVQTTIVFVTHDQVEAMTLADRVVVLQDGRIEQIGAPEDVYRFPANTFVAGFIGSPTMNLLDVRVADRGRALELPDGSGVPVPESRRPEFSGESGIVLGVRPEHFSTAGAVAGGALAVDVDVIEPLGSDTLISFVIADREMVARIPPRLGIAPGDRIHLGIDMDAVHFFDRETGKRLPEGGRR